MPPINPFDMRPNRDYDPRADERNRLWRGGRWDLPVWYLVKRGLAVQAARTDLPPVLMARCQDKVQHNSLRSYQLVEAIGWWEYQDAEKGRPLRVDKSPNFTWPALNYLLRDDFLPAASS